MNSDWLLLAHIGKESVIYDTQLPEGIDSVQHIQDMEEAAYRLEHYYVLSYKPWALSWNDDADDDDDDLFNVAWKNIDL